MKLSEATKKSYQILHDSYSDAIAEALDYLKAKGFTVSDDEVFSKITIGDRKPSTGSTNRISLEIYKNDKLQRKGFHIQVANLGNKYELNAYIA